MLLAAWLAQSRLSFLLGADIVGAAVPSLSYRRRREGGDCRSGSGNGLFTLKE